MRQEPAARPAGRAPPPAAGVDPLVVVTYNVHRCVGTDRRYGPERVATALAGLSPDVVALQEVDTGLRVGRTEDQLRYLARTLGLTLHQGPTLSQRRGEYGNAVLTRHPVHRADHLDLSVAGREPRFALDLDLRVGPATVRLVATHLGLSWRERQQQVARLVHALRSTGQQPLVVVGDFNEWSPVNRTVSRLDRELGKTRAPRTYPAHRPVVALDRIWTRPCEALLQIVCPSGPLYRSASDHRPLLARIAISA